MYKNAVAILRAKHRGKMSWDQAEHLKDSGWYFMAPYPASYYIDLVWKNFMKYEGYRTYCENLCGGYIDRPEPTDNMKKSHQAYIPIAEEFLDDGMIQALKSVWPVYEEDDDMALDFDYQVYGSPEMHEYIIEWMDEKIDRHFKDHDEVNKSTIEKYVWDIYDEYKEEQTSISEPSLKVNHD